MTTYKLHRMEETLEIAERFAKEIFGRDSDREAKVSDVVSVTWQSWVKFGHRISGKKLANFAIKIVKAKRQFPMETRSLDARSVKIGGYMRSDFDVFEIAAMGANPAKVAAFRLDFQAWLKSLKPTSRRIAKALARGDTTSQVAKRFHITRGRVSQKRRELADSWYAFTADRQ